MAEPAALIDPGSVHALLQAQFARAGLAMDGVCTGLSGYSAQWRQTAALLEDLSTDEADSLGALMPLVRARASGISEPSASASSVLRSSSRAAV